MTYLILLMFMFVVLIFHLEFDKMQKALVEKLDDLKLEQASRSIDDYYNA